LATRARPRNRKPGFILCLLLLHIIVRAERCRERIISVDSRRFIAALVRALGSVYRWPIRTDSRFQYAQCARA